MPGQDAPQIELALGQRGILTHATTAYVNVTLEKLLPALAMPDPHEFDYIDEVRREVGGRGG
jgi:hypothetical protein